MERLAYKLGMLYAMSLARWCGKDAECDLIHGKEGLESRGSLSTASGDPSHGKTVARYGVAISGPYVTSQPLRA
jgi:hypothetical protein